MESFVRIKLLHEAHPSWSLHFLSNLSGLSSFFHICKCLSVIHKIASKFYSFFVVVIFIPKTIQSLCLLFPLPAFIICKIN